MIGHTIDPHDVNDRHDDREKVDNNILTNQDHDQNEGDMWTIRSLNADTWTDSWKSAISYTDWNSSVTTERTQNDLHRR